MIMAYLVLIPILLLALWLFFKSSPKENNSKKILGYNLFTIFLAVALSVFYSLRLRASMIDGSDFGWWPVLSFLASLVIMTGVLILSGLLRNLLIFRGK